MAGFSDHAQVMGDKEYRHSAFLLQVLYQLDDLRLNGGVQGRGRLVSNEQMGIAAQRHGNHHALAHAAGHLVRVVFHAGLRLRNTDLPQHFDACLPCLLAAQGLVQTNGFHQLIAAGIDRIEAGHGFLKNHGGLLAAKPAEFFWG